jgi:two-component system, OmpR family, copper resistance phosphate regulon response regulator CusR
VWSAADPPNQSRREVIRILLVEDEKKLARSIKQQLERAGHVVEIAGDGIEAEEKVHHAEFHILVLDLNLPKKSGLDVLRDLRAASYTTPVLILTATDGVENRIKGLQLGADDYLVKPFDSGELLARIEAVLRRSGFSRTAILQAADLTLDVVKRTVERAGQKIDLSEKEFSLLEFLLRNKNKILTRKRLIEQVWGYQFDTGTNIVDVYMSYLRNAIDKGFSRKLIHTMHGEGFILVDN